MARLKPRSKDPLSDVLIVRPDISTLWSHCCYHPGVDPENLERVVRAEKGDRDTCQLYSYYISLKIIQNFTEKWVATDHLANP